MPRRAKNPKPVIVDLEENVKFTEEQLFTPPTIKDGILMEIYLEDKYTMYIANQEIRDKIKANNGYCLNNPNARCMCKEWKLLDEEATCSCGAYKKVLNDPEKFRKMREHSLSGPRFKD